MKPRGRTLVLGVGNRDRGDDGVGPAVTDHLRNEAPADITISAAPADASEILAAWDGASRVILVDVCRSGAPAGTIRRIDAAREALPPDPPGCSTHGFGVAAAIGLARALGALPEEVVIYAVEAETLDHGAPMSPPVAAAVTEVATRVSAEIARST